MSVLIAGREGPISDFPTERTAENGRTSVADPFGRRRRIGDDQKVCRLRRILELLLVLALPGCAEQGPFMIWDPRNPATQLDGRVAIVEVKDLRPPKQGGKDPRSVGNNRPPAGIPYPVNLEGDNTLTDTMSRLVKEATLAAGIGMTQVGDPAITALMAVEIQEFWCDGYPPVFKVNLKLGLSIIDPETKQVRQRSTVSAEASAENCEPAITKLLNSAFNEVTGILQQPPVRRAVVQPVSGNEAAVSDGSSDPSPSRPKGARRSYGAPDAPASDPFAPPARPSGAPPATGGESENDCPPGQDVTADTAGHCCWPDQVWSSIRKRCVGLPSCIEGYRVVGENCLLSCAAGREVGPDTGGHCCWPGQAWSNARHVCVGIPTTCPDGLEPSGEACRAQRAEAEDAIPADWQRASAAAVAANRLSKIARAFAPGQVPVSPVLGGPGQEQQEVPFTVALDSGRCYTVIGTVGPGVQQLSIYLFDPTGKMVAKDTSDRSISPHLTHCPRFPGPYKLIGTIKRGQGQLAMQAFTPASGAPLSPQTSEGRSWSK